MDVISSIPRVLGAVLATISFLCCSIKEDRDSCPCNLRFDLSEAYEGSDGTLTLVIQSTAGFVYCDTLSKEELTLTVHVPREQLTVDFYTPFGALDNPLQGYRPSSECDPIWMFSDTLLAKGELVERKVLIHKNYCGLKVSLLGESGVKPPYDLLFISNIDGYLPGGGLSEGLFVQRSSPDESGSCSVNILRQKDSSLMMEIVPEESDGVSLRSFAIGEYLASAGYDWEADSLDDIEITVDFASTTITLSTSKWTNTVSFSVMI